MGTTAFLGGVTRWIERLGLGMEEAAKLVDMEAQQLERLLNFPELTPMLRPVLRVLDGLGLGIVGVERLTTAMVVRHLDQCREAKKMTKSELASRAEVNRAHLTSLFQHSDPDPKLETVLKLAAAIECDLTIEQRRELPRPVASRAASDAATVVTHAANSISPPAPAITPPVAAASRPLAPASDTTSHRASTAWAAVARVDRAAENASASPPSVKPASASPSALSSSSSAGQATNPPPGRSSPPPASVISSPTPQSAAPIETAPRAPDAPDSATTYQTGAASRPTGATSRQTGAASHPTAPNSAISGLRPPPAGSAPTGAQPSNAPPRAPTTAPSPASPRATSDVRPPPASATPPDAKPSTSPPRAVESTPPPPSPAPTLPRPSPSPPNTNAAAPPHLDPALNPALAHVLERIAQARTRAELNALKAEHALEVQRLQYQHERQLAARVAAERAAAEDEARTNSMIFGGTAVAAAVAGTTALALQTPENRQTAQAILGLGGGALAITGALSQPGSTTRNVCLGLGIAAVGIAAVDLFCQMFSEPPGAIGVAVRPGHGTLVIQSIAPQSAAATAGLIAGDEILHVDGVAVAQLGANEAIKRLRGEVGSQVRIRVRQHRNGGLEWEATLVRSAR